LAIEDCDRNLYEVLRRSMIGTRRKNRHHRYSDHGFSTIKRNADVAAILKKQPLQSRPQI